MQATLKETKSQLEQLYNMKRVENDDSWASKISTPLVVKQSTTCTKHELNLTVEELETEDDERNTMSVTKTTLKDIALRFDEWKNRQASLNLKDPVESISDFVTCSFQDLKPQ